MDKQRARLLRGSKFSLSRFINAATVAKTVEVVGRLISTAETFRIALASAEA